ncbi:MAG: hypothetical protein P9L90_04725 [Candidatus Aadella gelida]|nr:hypothetical protein [Candidatus Aadella gelida]
MKKVTVLVILSVMLLGAASAYAGCAECEGKNGWQKVYDMFAKGPCKTCTAAKKTCSVPAKKGSEVCVKN